MPFPAGHSADPLLIIRKESPVETALLHENARIPPKPAPCLLMRSAAVARRFASKRRDGQFPTMVFAYLVMVYVRKPEDDEHQRAARPEVVSNENNN